MCVCMCVCVCARGLGGHCRYSIDSSQHLFKHTPPHRRFMRTQLQVLDHAHHPSRLERADAPKVSPPPPPRRKHRLKPFAVFVDCWLFNLCLVCVTSTYLRPASKGELLSRGLEQALWRLKSSPLLDHFQSLTLARPAGLRRCGWCRRRGRRARTRRPARGERLVRRNRGRLAFALQRPRPQHGARGLWFSFAGGVNGGGGGC